jgi:hypothetical protein
VAAAKSSQTITFTSTAPGSASVGGPTYTVAATASSGLAVSFTIDAASSSVCSISGTTVSFIGAGTCTIDANQAGNSNYNAAPRAQQSFTVGKGPQPLSTKAPELTGTPALGETLSCSQGSWENSPTSYAYKWLRDGGAISGQMGSTYKVEEADQGHSISCEVTASNAAGSASKASNTLSVPAAVQTSGSGGGSGSGGSGSGGSSGGPPPGAGSASVGGVNVGGSTVSELLSCTGASSATCELTLTLTVTETLKGGKVIGVSASKKKRPKIIKRIVTVGSVTVSLTGGQSELAKIALNAAGKRLLVSHHKLAARLTTTETGSGGHSTVLSSRTVTFKAPGKNKHKKKG